MKIQWLLTALILPSIVYSNDPFATGKDDALEGPSNLIEVHAEWLQVSEAEATALLHDEKAPTNSLEWRQKVNSLLKEGKAKVAASAAVVTQEGQTGETISQKEVNYVTSQTEFERAEPTGSGQFMTEGPVTRVKFQSDFEKAAHGLSLQVEPSLKEADIIHLDFKLEWSTVISEAPRSTEPEVFRISHRNSCLIRAGGSFLAGVSTPYVEKGKLDATQRLLCFVSARFVKP